MRVRVLLFGPLKDDLGGPWVEVEVPDPATVADVQGSLAARFPARGALLSRARIALNQRFVEAGHPVRSGDELAVIELVSGG